LYDALFVCETAGLVLTTTGRRSHVWMNAIVADVRRAREKPATDFDAR
jgi:hypothetical protein